jgi:hypothetical protein
LSTLAVKVFCDEDDELPVAIFTASRPMARWTAPFAAEPMRLTVRLFSSDSSRRPQAASLNRHTA